MMWKRSVLFLGVVLAACGTSTGAAPVDADVDGTATADIAGTDATADDLVDAAGTDAIGDVAGIDAIGDVLGVDAIADVGGTDALADSGQCLSLFTACKMGDTCCPPYQCMNMGNGLQCQGEGPDTGPQDVPKDADAAPDTVPDTAVGPDTTADGCFAADAVPAAQCAAGSSTFFPTFAKACTADAECIVAIHQINCCGTKVAWGIQACEQGQFAASEAQCESQYPGCGCAEFETMAEDGYSSFTASDFAAKCDAGVCRSYVKAAKANCTPQGLQDPKPVKTCTSLADCDFSMTTLDCCGSQEFVGIAKFAKKAFDVEAQKCGMSISLCDCMPKPTTLEDGKTLTTSAVPLACVNGACMTGTP